VFKGLVEAIRLLDSTGRARINVRRNSQAHSPSPMEIPTPIPMPTMTAPTARRGANQLAGSFGGRVDSVPRGVDGIPANFETSFGRAPSVDMLLPKVVRGPALGEEGISPKEGEVLARPPPVPAPEKSFATTGESSCRGTRLVSRLRMGPARTGGGITSTEAPRRISAFCPWGTLNSRPASPSVTRLPVPQAPMVPCRRLAESRYSDCADALHLTLIPPYPLVVARPSSGAAFTGGPVGPLAIGARSPGVRAAGDQYP
jgi:hypothetical protein